MSTAPAISIDEAVEALTFDVDGLRYAPPMFDELRASGIYDKVRTIISAMNTSVRMRAQLVGMGKVIQDDNDHIYAQYLLLETLEHAMLVAEVLAEEERKPVVYLKGALPGNRPTKAREEA